MQSPCQSLMERTGGRVAVTTNDDARYNRTRGELPHELARAALSDAVANTSEGRAYGER